MIGVTPREFTSDDMAELQRMAADVVLDIEDDHRLPAQVPAPREG